METLAAAAETDPGARKVLEDIARAAACPAIRLEANAVLKRYHQR